MADSGAGAGTYKVILEHLAVPERQDMLKKMKSKHKKTIIRGVCQKDIGAN